MFGKRLARSLLALAVCFGCAGILAHSQSGNQSGNVWAIVIGASATPAFVPLSYADDDAVLFYRLLTDPLGAQVPPKNVFLHLSEPEKARLNGRLALPATREAVLESVRTVARRAQSGDRVIIFFSGHGGVGVWTTETGDVDEKGERRLFLITSDTQTLGAIGRGVFAFIRNTGITVQEIADLLRNSFGNASIDVWFILDSCYAGAAAREQQEQLQRELQLQEEQQSGRGVEPERQQRSAEVEPAQSGAGRQRPPETGERVRFFYVFSSSGDQQSLEDSERKHGVFTYYLARALRGAALGASPYRGIPRPEDQLISADLGTYLKLNVTQRALSLPESRGLGQEPTAFPEFDRVPGVSFTRAERRYGISVEVESPEPVRTIVYLRSIDGKRVLVAEAPCLFRIADIDAQLGAGRIADINAQLGTVEEYELEIRHGRQRPLTLRVPLSLSAPTSVKVVHSNRGLEYEVRVGDKIVKPLPKSNGAAGKNSASR